MSAGESTPAPASVEQAAAQCAQQWADVNLGTTQEEYAYKAGYEQGWRDAAAADRAALELANGMLLEATTAKWLCTNYDCPGSLNAELRARINAHLNAQQPARLHSQKATATEIRETAGVTEDELRVGREAVEAIRPKGGRRRR